MNWSEPLSRRCEPARLKSSRNSTFAGGTSRSQQVPIVRRDDDGQRVLARAQWGFIPAWAKELPKTRPINAKAETVSTNGMFRNSFTSRRCLIPADGFYEWRGAKPPRQPYFIHMKDDGLFAFGGLWDVWNPHNDAASLDTFTLITTQPNDLMRPIDNRMPLIIPRRDYSRWLDSGIAGENVTDLLTSYPAEEMEAYPVGSRVNSPKNDGPELIAPVIESDLFS